MIDIRLIRENPDLVRENVKKKFQEKKLPLVDKAIELDLKIRELKSSRDEARKSRNDISDKIGLLLKEGKKEEAQRAKEKVLSLKNDIEEIENNLHAEEEALIEIMRVIPNIIEENVPIGEDDSKNVELEVFGDKFVRDFEIPYHADVCSMYNGIDKESAARTSGSGFYFLMGDIARLHSAMLSYARDFMIEKGFTYCIPPCLIKSDVVTGVMSFEEMNEMMYKIDGEDLFLIGTSEHSMIGKFKNQLIKEEELPIRITGYSSCFRKEVGAHGIEERGLYRVHQFEKEEMIVICKPEDSKKWYEKMWQYTVEYFRNLNVVVRTLECCSGDLADLKYKSCDVEAWSPRQQKFFEVGSCSNLTDAQARRLGIRIKSENGNYLAHTLNNTVIASPRGLIAFIENNINEDYSINIPEVLRPYMGGKSLIYPNK